MRRKKTGRTLFEDVNRAPAPPAKPEPLDDDTFMMLHVMENGFAKPRLLKERRGSGPFKSKYEERRRAEAEAAAETILRHRIAANEKAHPAIFEIIRSPDFLSWYEAIYDEPWDRRFESDIDELRFRVMLAQQREERLKLLAVRDESVRLARESLPARILAEKDGMKRRRLRVELATPAWADLTKIAAIYRERDRMTAETGRLHHVDHIIPIAGELACGLHVEFNLRPIEAKENLRKHNRFDTA